VTTSSAATSGDFDRRLQDAVRSANWEVLSGDILTRVLSLEGGAGGEAANESQRARLLQAVNGPTVVVGAFPVASHSGYALVIFRPEHRVSVLLAAAQSSLERARALASQLQDALEQLTSAEFFVSSVAPPVPAHSQLRTADELTSVLLGWAREMARGIEPRRLGTTTTAL